MKRKIKRARQKILDRAYDKCARLEPGESVVLAPLEEELLLRAIRRYERKVDRPRREKVKAALNLAPATAEELYRWTGAKPKE